jgi:Zinc finger, C2H2 type
MPVDDNWALNGDYSFMDYAVLYWLRHLESAAEGCHAGQEMEGLAESLQVFVQLHWKSPGVRFQISNGNTERLQHFKHLYNYDQLEQAVASTRKHLTFFGEMPESQIALNLIGIVSGVRKSLERLVSNPLTSEREFEKRYGKNIFKCNRMSCQFFTAGFETADDRDTHVGNHERPFRCKDQACTGFTWGFARSKHLERHMLDHHRELGSKDQEFPTNDEIEDSARPTVTEPEPAAIPLLEEATAREASVEQPEPELMGVENPRLRKRGRPEYFTCEHCSKEFKKKYNWTSHLLSHGNERPFQCRVCRAAFQRSSDCTRHESKHESKRFKCGGTLPDGREWGCGRLFSRADELSAHHYRSKTGRECLKSCSV